MSQKQLKEIRKGPREAQKLDLLLAESGAAGEFIRFPVELPDVGKGHLQVSYERGAGGAEIVAAVELRLTQGMTARQLSNLPWSRLLTMADAGRRFSISSDLIAWPQVELAVDNAIDRKRPSRAIPGKRPGRPGWSDDHYRDVANAYRLFYAKGHRNPTALVAEKFNVNRNTAAGWIGVARKKGYLLPARPRKAG